MGEDSEPYECELPVEHNVEGTWHESEWRMDDEELRVRWAPEIGETCFWPPIRPVFDPLGNEVRSYYSGMMLKRIMGVNYLATNVPAEIPATGTVVNFRRWGSMALPDSPNGE